MLADEDFLHAKCRRMHADQHEVMVDGAPPGRFRVTVVRTMPTDAFPDLARPFVGRHVHIRQVDDWWRPDADGQRDGVFALSIAGAPVTLQGRYELRVCGPGTRIVMRGGLRAAVPFLGHRLERLAEPAIRAAIRHEQEAGTAWLAG